MNGKRYTTRDRIRLQRKSDAVRLKFRLLRMDSQFSAPSLTAYGTSRTAEASVDKWLRRDNPAFDKPREGFREANPHP
jgi:hypothetical protein